MAFLSYRAPVPKTARRDALFGGANEATGGFGSLEVVLGDVIRAVYANRWVRLRSLSKNLPLTNTSSESCMRGGGRQNPGPPFTYIFVGNAFSFAPWRCGRTEAPG